ncbi:MAG: penicillin-binding protein 2 [Fibrobacteria bacterium]|nr:penicillin-binding protein 2 [Fibrobacteria bacterium]
MNPGRTRLLQTLFLALFGAIGLRLAWIQVVEGPDLREAARNQTRLRLLLDAPRGEILATDGSVLAGENPDGRRGWPWGSMALPVLGLVGRDGNGLMGLEYRFDDILHGTPGWKTARRTGRGQAWPDFDDRGSKPRPGLAVVTTLRPTLQGEAEAALAEAVARHGATGGTVVVVEARTGDVAALASLPAPVDLRSMAQGRVEVGAVHRTYEPGSTFKAISLAAALETGNLQEDDLFLLGPSWDPGDGRRPIRDAHPMKGRHGYRSCLEHSSNVCFAQIAQIAGSHELYRVARNFGFGTPTGIDLPGEESGLLKTVDQWSMRTLPTMAIGQEVAVTPLQMAMAYAALANGGLLMRPRLVRALVSPEGDTVERFQPRPVRQAVRRETAENVMQALKGVVDSGTGGYARIQGLPVGGKTGTSQKVDPENGRYFQDRFMASFIGIVPLRGAPMVCLVVLDDPTEKGHTGGITAAPVFGRIVRFALRDPSQPWGDRAPDAPGTLASALGGRRSSPSDSLVRTVAAEESPG